MKIQLISIIFIPVLIIIIPGCTPNPVEENKQQINEAYLYLQKAEGRLKVDKMASTETYEAYFHIPVSFAEQVPILIQVESAQLIDYRFIHLNPPNVIIAARMRQANFTELTWTAWVLITDNQLTASDLPATLPIPGLDQLPDWTKKWLESTGCVQVEDSLVQEIAANIRGDTTDLKKLTDDITNYCYNIPGKFQHSPHSYDAVYALKWGNSCTGHAHAGAALLRANGIPARSILNITLLFYGYQDMHWIVDYYVPDYGWIKMETTMGLNYYIAKNSIVTMVCHPGDEFPVFYPGIEGFWHTSDPALGILNPNWGRAHRGYRVHSIADTTEKIQQSYSITQAVFDYYTHCLGLHLSPDQQTRLETALRYQANALTSIENMDIDGYITNMQEALKSYEQINLEPIQTLFFDDFENGNTGWTHGGTYDEWELGTPSYGPIHAYSGDNCWGTDLDNTYENNAHCWLLSPPIDLNHLSCAYLSFHIWNWVEDGSQGEVFDPLWLDITTDGTTFYPLCSYMGGVNDDPEIPDTGGWNMLHLDLSKYIGQTVQIRFCFQSNDENVQPGSYIDDVKVYGRRTTQDSHQL